ncbi:hypothetical protein BT69DRAFT_1281128 [Atractiella rhizophila]|nr:hypothetical protein BT69DRAFT_1281128 [Atractiella rhizophila]
MLQPRQFLRLHQAHFRPSVWIRSPLKIPAARFHVSFPSTSTSDKQLPPVSPPPKRPLTENIYTIPNFLTVGRIAATPVIGYLILHNDFKLATSLLAVAAVSDIVDGYLARRWSMMSTLGTILDPAADKFLMTVLAVTLTMKGLLPVYLCTLIVGRDAFLALSAFYLRWKTLPQPKTFKRYWDMSIPSVEAAPTTVSKYNTFLQLILVGGTTMAQILPFSCSPYIETLQVVVAITTVWSGVDYLRGKGIRYIR